MEFLNAALRRLAAAQKARDRDMPRVVAVQLTGRQVRFDLAELADADQPWVISADRLQWVVNLDVELDEVGPDAAGQLADVAVTGATSPPSSPSHGIGGVWLRRSLTNFSIPPGTAQRHSRAAAAATPGRDTSSWTVSVSQARWKR